MDSFLSSKKCPICHLESAQFVEFCKRCGCNLLLIAKIQWKAFRLKQKGKDFESKLFYSFEEGEIEKLSKLFDLKVDPKIKKIIFRFVVK